MRQNQFREAVIILNYITLGDSIFWEEDLVEVVELLFGGRFGPVLPGHRLSRRWIFSYVLYRVGRDLANALLRILVRLQPQEYGRAQQAVLSEFQEFHATD